MDLSPLTVVVLLAFGLLIAFRLTLWTTLGSYGRATRSDDGGRSASDTRTDRHDEGRRTTTRGERPTVERRQESRGRGDKSTSGIRTEPTPVVLPPESSRVRRSASDSRAKDQEQRTRSSSTDKTGEKTVKPGQPARSRRGKDDDDAFERFLKAKDEFDIR